ncbi:MAG: carboxylesterase/lipase family protein [Bacteroidaceae bacterium]|nr:carboxylesterase/lipase family protein [Bacteroidaceae bacterium]
MRMSKKSFFVKGASMLCIGVSLLLMSACGGAQNNNATVNEEDEQQIYIGDNIAVAQTQYGKVRGFIQRGVYTYLGIRYGADTSGENRFMPAKAPEPWDDIKDAVYYGNCAPQNDPNYANNRGVWRDHWNYGNLSEDCLFLNVWTPNTDNAKRPVLVWFHGGGYAAGNGIEQDGYNGENMAKKGDVVFVSVNHRLNAFGFTDFSGVDPKYFESGNVGTTDMVAALKWVHNNIANFGGDPDNVTIMGQSGGGAKVSVLVAMPETQGLIHKAVALSGNGTSAQSQAASRELGKFIVKKSGKTVAQLQQMPWREYLALANACSAEFNRNNAASGVRAGFSPVADGIHVPVEGYYKDPNAPSANIPMIYCTTTAESSPSAFNAQMEDIDRAEVIRLLGQRYQNGKAEQIYDAYAKVFENQKPIDIYALASSSRVGVINSANTKSAQKAPVYLAWFGWNPPLFDGRARAFHCVDICFWFKNTDLMLSHTGGGKRPRDLSDKMSEALIAFMRTGNPNCPSLPEWPAYTPEQGATMIFNDVCEVKNDPDREARALLQ